jgi:AbrB family looped-hinge helix DNA binding protein
MSEVIRATGSPQYNKLKALKSKGFVVRKVKEGDETRYFVIPPASRNFEATPTSQGQVTIPKEIREHLGLRAGQKVRFGVAEDGRVTIAPSTDSVRDLFGILGKPPRAATLNDLDTAIVEGAVKRYRQSER